MSFPDPPPPGPGAPGGPPPGQYPPPGSGYPPGPGYPSGGGYPQGAGPPPGPGYPPGPGHPYGGPPPAAQGTDGFAIAALVFGIIGGVLLAVIFAIVALVRIGKSGRKGKGLAIAALVLSALWVVALVAIFAVASDDEAADDEAARDDSGEVVEGGDVSAFDVSVGDCWNDIPAQQEVESIATVPCSEPHESEVFATFDIDLGSDDWPGDQAVIEEAEAGCVERFGEFVGVPYEQSALEIFYFHPTEDSWTTLDDREAVCSVVDPAGQTTGSLAGTAR